MNLIVSHLCFAIKCNCSTLQVTFGHSVTGQKVEKIRGCIIMLDGSVAGYLSYMQNRKPASSRIFMSTLFHKRKMILEYIVSLTFN